MAMRAAEAEINQGQTLGLKHKIILKAGGIEDVAVAAGIWSASSEEVKTLTGIDAGPGMVFPYPGPDGFCRVRLDEPFQAPGWDKPAKYLTPKGAGNHLYIPANLPAGALTGGRLVITEGEKKALAACARGIPCIATAGVWSWKARNSYGEKQDDGDGLLPDFDTIVLDSRTVVLVYDSDINQEHVAWPAYGRLAEQLYARGAHAVTVVSLPDMLDPGQGKTGLDDYLVKRTPEDFRKLTDTAPTWIPSGDGARPFAARRLARTRERLQEQKDPSAAYDEETKEALAALMMLSDLDFAGAAQGLGLLLPARVKLHKRSLEQQVRLLVMDAKRRQVSTREPDAPDGDSIEEFLPDCPVKLRRPYGWQVYDRGVQRRDEKAGVIVACPVPVVLSRRLLRIDTNEEKIEFVFRRDGAWRRLAANRSTVFHRTQLVTLADQGLPVSSESAKDLVTYLAAMEAANLDLLPVQKVSGRFGWVGPQQFLPGAAGDVEFDTSKPEDAATASAYTPEGGMEAWLGVAREARENPMVRLSLAAGFAAPLLKIVGHRTFGIYIYGDSRSGKSAAHALAVSIWADPESAKASFYATRVGLERLAQLYCDLPLWIDERQAATGYKDGQGLVEGLVYMLGLGKGKVRGAKSGGIQATATWRTIFLASGEVPLIEYNTPTGVITRTLEFHAAEALRPFASEEEAANVYAVTAKHHGHAGPAFVRRLIEELARAPESIAELYEQMREVLAPATQGLAGSHVTALAVLCLADALAGEWVFGETESVAGARALAEVLAGSQETAAEADWTRRAFSWLRGWIAQHDIRFKDNPGERWGWHDVGGHGRVTYIMPNVLGDHLREAGFSVRRALSEWKSRGWILTEEWGGKNRCQVRRIIPWRDGDYEGRRSPVVAILDAEAEE